MLPENTVRPGLILITDEFPRRHGAGIGQAMYNFFAGYEGSLYVLLRHTDSLPPAEERLPAQPIRYHDARPGLVYNRLAPYLNPLLQRWQYHRRHRMPLPGGLPPAAHSLVVVATTSPVRLHMAWVLMQGGYRVVPFFMDDWLHNNTLQWRGGSIQQVASDIFRKAPGCIFISTQLAKVLQERYHSPCAHTLILQNPATRPADTTHKADRQTTVVPGKLLYAGNVWPMHADALIALAAALSLSSHHSLHLDIYCPPHQWEKYATLQQGSGVYYKGWLPTADAVRQQYPTAQWLVCCASFAPEHAPFTIGSIQSKISDYLAAGRPVLYVGPAESASYTFVEELQCGRGITTPEPAALAKALEALAADEVAYTQYAANGQQAANGPLHPRVVQQKLYAFLTPLDRKSVV